MSKKIISVLLAFALFLCGCGIKKERIIIGTAGEGGVYYTFGNSFANVMSPNEMYEFDVKETAGSAANLRLISEGYIEMGIAQADLIDDAYNGKGDFENKVFRGYKAVAGLYMEACHIVVRKDSSIESIDDLQGKNVSIGNEESGTERNAKQILQAYGMNDSHVHMVNLDYKKAAEKLKNGQIDAMFCTVGINTDIIEELSQECNIRLLEIDSNHISKLMMGCTYFSEYEIPADTYIGQVDGINTVGVQSVLVVSERLDNDIVYEITKNIFEHSDEICGGMSEMGFDEKMATVGTDIEIHDGAMMYYNEKNIMPQNGD